MYQLRGSDGNPEKSFVLIPEIHLKLIPLIFAISECKLTYYVEVVILC